MRSAAIAACLVLVACGSDPATAPLDPAPTPALAVRGGGASRGTTADGRTPMALRLVAVHASRPGEHLPGLVRVTCELELVNESAHDTLALPLLVPLTYEPDTAAGGVAVEGGGDVVVTMPSTGMVRPGPAWTLPAERRFAHPGPCRASGSGCQPALRLAGALPPGGRAAVVADFDVEPTVHRLRLRVAVAARR